ncbi:MAG: uracil-DNA glycosylase [Candidatus Solibacter usitatus]|nr:uracil-DNA glycosylase [Candidatus Solibacter usitatus]
MADSPVRLESQIVNCEQCPRLRDHCREVARVKRRAYLDCDYWGRPVPGFGDQQARVLIVGLAPGAHGANRTGRVFTGDRSGDWLYRALWQTGFANQPTSLDRGDGLRLNDAWVSASVRCAPPGNRPLPAEIAACRPFLAREVALLRRVRVVVALGRIAFDNCLTLAREAGGVAARASFPFAHDRQHPPTGGGPVLISSYHPSQQNTSTGRLTEAMLRAVFERARSILRA